MTRRRRVVLTAIAALLAGTLWWIVRGPAMGSRAAAPASAEADAEVDLDLPAQRERRDGLLALATMPDDPWTLAESLAPSPASAPAVMSRCGVDQRASVGEASASDGDQDAPPAKPPGLAYRTELARLDVALRTSSDVFERAVANWIGVGGQQTSEGTDALVRGAAASTDRRVYALAYRTCHVSDWDPTAANASQGSSGSCALLSARRWSELDPGNAVPWMYVFTQGAAAGDATTQNEALLRMAASTRFEDRMHEVSGVVVGHASSDDDGLAADLDVAEAAFQKSVGQNESFSALMSACRGGAGGDANRAQQCQAIGELMYRHGDNLLLQAMGAGIVFQASGDPTLRDQGRAERSAMLRAWSPATGMSDCGMVREGLTAMRQAARVGELEAMRERTRAPVPP